MYKKLVEMYKRGELSFKYVKTFNMDEYVDLPRDHAESYHSYMWNNFFKHIDILPENAHVLDGNADDLVAECAKFEKEILNSGGVDLFVGGKQNTCSSEWCLVLKLFRHKYRSLMASRDRSTYFCFESWDSMILLVWSHQKF